MTIQSDEVVIREIGVGDYPDVLALNSVEQHFTSEIDGNRLDELIRWSAHHRVACSGRTVFGFILAMGQSSAYDGVNFRWFADRYPSFLYVDRIVVARESKGRGIGAALYRDLFAQAAKMGVPVITCEINVEPPNPASLAFHERFGFREVGRASSGNGLKQVSYQQAHVREN
ncbi:MAG: GNAT family N-acetyltransferase [Pseudomonadota bacterium]